MDLDLNLLRVFDTLMELRSVTRAAERLGLTQSAVSHALGRLRAALDDPLFVRSAQGLLPTSRAADMAVGVREGLRRLADTVSPQRAEGGASSRRFTIAAGSYFCAMLIPALVERASREAPGVSFRVVPSGDDLVAALDRGAIELAFSAIARAPGRFMIEPLFEDELVWIAARRGELAAMAFNAADIATRPRVVIAARLPFDAPDSPTGDLLMSSSVTGYPLDDATWVYDSRTAIAIVAMTDLVAQVPRRMAIEARERVAVLGPSSDPPLFISMLWHVRQRADPGLIWLRGLIRSLV